LIPEPGQILSIMTMAFLERSARSTIEHLIAGLSDAQRHGRTALGVVAGYVGLWSVYGVFSKSSQDAHFDLGELAVWASQPALGYNKHPPFAAWLMRLWFTFFPLEDWACYLLAMTSVGVGLLAAWHLFGRWVDGEKRVVALALLTFIPLLNFHALKFNPNVVMIPLWALTTLCFVRSMETRCIGDAALAGATAAAAMLGKYWSIYLLAGLGVAALVDRHRGRYFRSVAPWVTICVGLVVLAPHFGWLMDHDFATLRYGLDAYGGSTYVEAAGNALRYLTGAVAYVGVPVAVAILATRPDHRARVDILWPGTFDGQFAACALWVPLLLPALVALLAGGRTTSLWTMPAWSLLPVMLMSSPLVTISTSATIRITTFAVAFPIAMVAVSPLVALVIHHAGISHYGAHYRLVAGAVEREWRHNSPRPLRFLSGEYFLTRGAAFYLSDRPSIVDDTASREAQPRLTTDGIAFVCPASDIDCGKMANSYLVRSRSHRTITVKIVRHYLGFAGTPALYLIIIVPPQSPSDRENPS
jgi:4-amino-4-deoxy-L-arabinose transferase-like glycosyltransferase